jgi:hypothetical protein
MPVQFLCDHCHKLLKVGRKKIGCEVTCPTCGRSTTVPDEETAAVGVAMHAATRASQTEEPALPEFAVFDDLPPLVAPELTVAAVEEAPRPRPLAAAPTGSTPPAARPDLRGAPRRTSAAPAAGRGPMLLVSRTTLYIQAGLFAVVAVAAFAAGFLIGRGAAPPAAAEAVQEPVVVEGTLTFTGADGEIVHDEGAVVLAIPADRFPDPKWKAEGLAPRDPEPAPGAAGLAAVEELDARYARTDGDGYYQLTVPTPGTYRFLFISARAARPSDEDLSDRELDELRRYFTPAPAIVGRSKFHWKRVELAAGAIRNQSHDFGIDGR